jgi:hypothetical protein
LSDSGFPLATILLLVAAAVLGAVVLTGVLLKVCKRIVKRQGCVYRSSVKGDRNSEVVYHMGEHTDEETDEDIFKANNNADNK